MLKFILMFLLFYWPYCCFTVWCFYLFSFVLSCRPPGPCLTETVVVIGGQNKNITLSHSLYFQGCCNVKGMNHESYSVFLGSP